MEAKEKIIQKQDMWYLTYVWQYICEYLQHLFKLLPIPYH